MNEPQAQPVPAERPTVEPQSTRADADSVMTAYVGYLAGWFEIGRLAAGRRLDRAGLRSPLLND
jgi:hypothetical protein